MSITPERIEQIRKDISNNFSQILTMTNVLDLSKDLLAAYMALGTTPATADRDRWRAGLIEVREFVRKLTL